MLTNTPSGATRAFRDLFRNVPGPVVVVSASEGGAAHATTVSSFSSLSLVPSYALVSLDLSSRLLGVIERTGRLGINLLTDRQKDVGLRCASKDVDKLRDIDWHESLGLPRINGCAGWLACEAAQIIEVGDHKIVVARPLQIDSSPDDEPLLYHRADFRVVGALA